jgi:hypothetical protein
VTPAEILDLIRRYRLAVVSTVSADGGPQAAVVGFAISDRLETGSPRLVEVTPPPAAKPA